MVTPIAVDTTIPVITTQDRSVSLLPANSKPLEHALASATAKLELMPVPFDVLWDADQVPDQYLPFLAYAWSVDDWNDNWTPDVQRAVIKNSLWVHQRKGTLGAVKRALANLNYDTKIIEWFQKTPPATPGTFSIEITPTKDVLSDTLQQLMAVINSVKRLSAHYELIFNTITASTISVYAATSVGVEITVTN